MNLNGQCEIAFNEWMKDKEYVYWFMRSPHEMQHGVKVKFFDSVGWFIEVGYDSNVFHYQISTAKGFVILKEYATREEAETKAEQKANDIYNENY